MAGGAFLICLFVFLLLQGLGGKGARNEILEARCWLGPIVGCKAGMSDEKEGVVVLRRLCFFRGGVGLLGNLR